MEEVAEWKDSDGQDHLCDANRGGGVSGDIEMGVIQGENSCAAQKTVAPQQQQQQHPQRYHQYIIALSANADSETVKEALAAGADEFMVKPFGYETFAALMDKKL